MDFNTIVDMAKKVEKVFIIGHTNPDGDCVGSTLALAMLLDKANVRSKVILKDIPNTYGFLPIDTWVIDKVPNEIGLLLVLDCGDLGRLGEFQVCASKANIVINIDHHISNTNFGMYNYVNSQASSTSEMIYDLLEDKTLLDKAIAKAIYTGIIYDTGVFKHSSTTEKTHKIASELISFGFDFSDIIDKVFYAKTLIGLKTQSKAIQNIRVLNEKVILTYLTKEDITALGTDKKQTEGIVQILNEVEDMACAVFIYESEIDVYKVSLRSKGTVDVCEVAKFFGGGGHTKASGCMIEGHLEEVIKKIMSVINEQI